MPLTGSPSPIAACLPRSFFARPCELVAPDLIGCLLVKRETSGELLWGVIVETEAYCQSEPACHGHRRRSPSNDTLFGEPGRFYVYMSHGIHHCVNLVTGRADWANGVLLRAVSLPGEPERIAAGPALLARRFGIDRSHDRCPADPSSGLWLAARPPQLQRLPQERPTAGAAASSTSPGERAAPLQASEPGTAAAGTSPLLQTTRIGIRQGQELPWRWYLRSSRSVSRRASGDRPPPPARAWTPDSWDLRG